jgi:hypothetical protein
MAAALGPFIQAEHALVGQRHLALPRHVAPAGQLHIGDGVTGGATRAGGDHGRTVAGEAGDAGRRVVSMASAGVMAGRMVVSRRASIDLPALGGRSSRRFGTQRRRVVPLYDASVRA